jgi:hypothetical protein
VIRRGADAATFVTTRKQATAPGFSWMRRTYKPNENCLLYDHRTHAPVVVFKQTLQLLTKVFKKNRPVAFPNFFLRPLPADPKQLFAVCRRTVTTVMLW